MNRLSWSLITLLACLQMLAGCNTRTYTVAPFDPMPFMQRANVEKQRGVTVSTTVATAEESQQIFGLPLYSGGVQPVWIRIENNTGTRLRYAPVSTDREYFAPLEVSYVNRGGFAQADRRAMNRHFYRLAMPRYVYPGETTEGFVFTHVRPGTKGYNIDLFGNDVEYRFSFFVTVPGFVPDHAEIEFEKLYSGDQVINLSMQQFLADFSKLPCCTTNATGDAGGSPLNIALIGPGRDILYALLRARWREGAAGETAPGTATGDYFFLDRHQDAIFRYPGRSEVDGYYELRVWLSPRTVDAQPLWLGQLRHFFTHRWTRPRPDPDIDEALEFFWQNLWYSETLLKFSIVDSNDVVSLSDRRTDFQQGEYFTQGQRIALWVSSDSVPLNEVQVVDGH